MQELEMFAFLIPVRKIRGVFCHLVVIYCTKLSKHGKTFRVRIRVSGIY